MPDSSETSEGYNDLLVKWLTDLRLSAKQAHSKAEFTYLKVRINKPEHMMKF